MSRMSHILVVGVPAGKSFQIQRGGVGVRVVAVDSLQQVKQEAQKVPIDGVVLSEKTAKEGLSDLPHVIDVSKTLIISGPPSLQAALDTMKWLLGKFDEREAKRRLQAFPGLTLEDYVELKFGEFVHTMKASSAKGLHVTLIQAVERPLIQHALHETNGNQVQAAKLLGMNRNTLRKKITEYHISVPRRSRQETES
ncbi:MAG: hypothetical protein F4201_02165 [Nitrospira sp. SB0677_bin_15]|nr:hypothetical protein [Nitrospira sp. SB0677_bin_15]